MSEICPRCGYTTEYRGNMKRHLNRKFICKLKNQVESVVEHEIKTIIEPIVKYKPDVKNAILNLIESEFKVILVEKLHSI